MKHETVLPKNIRQIGEIQQDKKVYLEDYVMTFIRKREKDAQEKDCAGILLGTKEQGEAGVFMFVKGAVHLEEEEEQEQKRQSYFPELEVLGLMAGGILNDNLELVCRWNYELDELGLDRRRGGKFRSGHY